MKKFNKVLKRLQHYIDGCRNCRDIDMLSEIVHASDAWEEATPQEKFEMDQMLSWAWFTHFTNGEVI